MSSQGLNLGIVGNGTVAGLVDTRGCYQWLCLPRFDGEPVFNRLMNGTGTFGVWMEGLTSQSQTYDRNTAVLRTRLTAKDGSELEIVDFAPRFERNGRVFRPASVVRQFRVISGEPQIRIDLTVQKNWGQDTVEPIRGVNHVRFGAGIAAFRITTDAPVSYVLSGVSFLLDHDVTFILGADEPLNDSVSNIADDWLRRTTVY